MTETRSSRSATGLGPGNDCLRGTDNHPGPQARRLNEPLERLAGRDMVRLATMGMMTAGITHDLGNFLQIMSSTLHLIDRGLDESTNPDLRPLLQGALAAVERAGILRRSILEMSKSRRVPEDINFLDTTLAAIKDLITLTAGPSIELSFVCSDDVPAVVCNSSELERAILNLVINAKDAMPLGGRLTVAALREPDPCGGPARAVLRMTDTGCGMSAETAAQVFEPFFTTKPSDQGTGLGLALVRDFARRVGGVAEIESTLGEGTAVILRLPGFGV